MKPYISVITLAVNNLEQSLKFYCEGLGLHSEGILGQEYEYGAVAFIELQSDIKLAGGVSKSMLTLNEAIIDVKEG